MKRIFDPASRQGNIRWDFFRRAGNATRILNFWVSPRNAPSAQVEVTDWAVEHTATLVAEEARKITESGLLRSSASTRPITVSNVLQWDMSRVFARIKSGAATTTTRIYRAFTEAPRRLATQGEARARRTATVIASNIFTSLGEYSNANNFNRRLMGLYLYATGTGRQVITVLVGLGISESYTNLVAPDTRSKAQRQKDKLAQQAGQDLSTSAREDARKLAEGGLFGEVYDNINMSRRNAEQIIGRHDTQENGTCATIWPLRDADPEDMKLSDFTESFDKARPLLLSDLLHTSDESKLFRECLIHCLLRIIDLESTTPATADLIDLLPTGATILHPLPPMEVDESTINGNAEVDNVISYPWFWQRARIIAGDQLINCSHAEVTHPFVWGAWMPGLFHGKVADSHGMLTTHFGKPHCGTRNPGCLAFHNEQLRRLPISLTSLPPFRTCRDLIFVSLYSRVLHCLLLVSGYASLGECAKGISDFSQLRDMAEEIFDTYCNSTKGENPPKLTQGDMVYENALLFMRDALISREFTDAIKRGDSGTWALSFRGNGRTKYAYEMLHVIHNLTTVWPPGIRKVVLRNWLLNPSGHPNSWVEVDLAQEHMNFWIKSYYKAHGSNASWEWLQVIGPCVQALRHITAMMKHALGVDIGTNHSSPDLQNDIAELMQSLDEHNVYRIIPGRVTDEDDPPVPDVISVGLQALTDSTANPLNEYNKAFIRLQARQRMTPVPSNTSVISTPSILPEIIDINDEDEDEDTGEWESPEDDPADIFDYEEDEPTLERNDFADISFDMDNDSEPSFDDAALEDTLMMIGTYDDDDM
ncbi:hypothetical protein BT96DRAFT_1080381 [Gymnopus androsaceus JB14]|uniref:DUF6589 domain-containing protein n=1 Tax=Gymnopus androsaceus JB14 TaxID=1447944 RepID=A0A6A4GQ55_9AGAR|nr:hypothetical protein BT96DRAFT_1080381 [Gymnopus androsaceus JB14]